MKNKQSIIFWHLILSCIFILPLSQFICVRLIFITLLFSFFVKKNKQQSPLFSSVWDIAVYLSILILGLFYTEDLKFGLSVLETRFSLFALPFIFYKIDGFDKKKLHQLFRSFSFGLLTASLIYLINATVNYIGTKNIHSFFFYNLTNVLDFQPTYVAYYIIFVISFGLYILYFDHVSTNNKWVLASLLFLFLVLMLTGGLTSFMSLLFVLSFFVLKFLTDDKTKIRTQAFGIVLIMIVGMFLFSLVYKNLDAPSNKITDHWERIALWESAIKANPNIWMGVGTGDHKNELNQFLIEHQVLTYKNHNSYNQFIQILLSNGIIGLIALLILILRPLYLSIRNQNVLGALTFFPFLIYGMTEVFFGRFQGVVFFAVLHQAFITFYMNSRSSQPIN